MDKTILLKSHSSPLKTALIFCKASKCVQALYAEITKHWQMKYKKKIKINVKMYLLMDWNTQCSRDGNSKLIYKCNEILNKMPARIFSS